MTSGLAFLHGPYSIPFITHSTCSSCLRRDTTQRRSQYINFRKRTTLSRHCLLIGQTQWTPSHNSTEPLSMVAKDGTISDAQDKQINPPQPPSPPPTATTKSERRTLRERYKVQIRVATGFVLGGLAIAWIFAGPWPFLTGLTVASVLGQNEYYKMAMAKGHAPAQKMGLISTAITMVLSAIAPVYADVVFPLAGTIICCYLLFRRRKIATIADISTTFMGLFYAGFLPSFWVRLHGYGFLQPTAGNPSGFVGGGGGGGIMTPLGHVISSKWPKFLPYRPVLSMGAMIVFWTWLANASADIGAFFFGRYFGKTRFSDISPKKTVEGACAGFICAASISVLGAFLMRWPCWMATGLVYGITVGVVGLLGDLFASTFKRDAGWKDSGKLFPGHGGILDRTDSYVLIAPLVYYFVTIVLPLVRQFNP